MSTDHKTLQTSQRHQRAVLWATEPTPYASEHYPVTHIRYYLDGFLLKHRSQRHSPKTIEFYRDRLRNFCWFLENQGYPMDLASIHINHIRHFLISLQEEVKGRWDSNNPGANRPMKPRSIHAYARCLRT
jgi:site-specific recombinase XerD